MLSRLTIKNVALIENADITFGEGLNVLSGETGAGKSVILDSVNFVLGAKADRTMIRYGETECLVKAEFFVPESSRCVQALREMDIDSDGEILISRKFTDNGKNVIKINGNTVTATMLRQITDSLVDVHGQSEHFFLLSESNQLKLLDDVVGEPMTECKRLLLESLKEKREIEENLKKLGGDEKERGRRLDVLRFQIDEIEQAELQDGEEEQLIAKRNKINNLEKIIVAVRDAIQIFSGETGVLDGLRAASRAVGAISSLDEQYREIYDKIESVAIEADDVSESLSELADELYFDENEAEETEQRLELIRSLKRKYGADIKEINDYLQTVQEEYELLSNCEEQFGLWTKKRENTLQNIYKICGQMTNLRKKHGEDFCQRVTEELKTLNIQHAQFSISFNEYTKQDADKATRDGLDSVSFLFSANAGEPMKPLGKIISGGEMSRFMLAVKTQLSNVNEISTYIFDEIDAGISGKTAKVVAEKLAKIAKNTQILAVSHLAQIAVMSDNQFLIKKTENEEKTLTNVYTLDEQGRLQEIVRLLGGESTDDFAVSHAKELLKQAQTYKNTL